MRDGYCLHRRSKRDPRIKFRILTCRGGLGAFFSRRGLVVSGRCSTHRKFAPAVKSTFDWTRKDAMMSFRLTLFLLATTMGEFLKVSTFYDRSNFIFTTVWCSNASRRRKTELMDDEFRVPCDWLRVTAVPPGLAVPCEPTEETYDARDGR